MKKTAITFLLSFLLISCGRESSPEGRFQIRFEQMTQTIDSLKSQNTAILDSLSIINGKLEGLKVK